MPNKAVDLIFKRLDKMEEKLETHLEESGLIKADLAWVKKAVWVGSIAGGTALAGIAVQLFLMIVNH